MNIYCLKLILQYIMIKCTSYVNGQFIEFQIVANLVPMQEQFEDTKWVIRNRKLKDSQHNGQRKMTKGQTTVYKTLHRKLKIEQREPIKYRGELRCSGRISSSCSTSDTCRVTLVKNPVISLECGNDREVFTTSGTYPWSFVTPIFRSR